MISLKDLFKGFAFALILGLFLSGFYMMKQTSLHYTYFDSSYNESVNKDFCINNSNYDNCLNIRDNNKDINSVSILVLYLVGIAMMTPCITIFLAWILLRRDKEK